MIDNDIRVRVRYCLRFAFHRYCFCCAHGHLRQALVVRCNGQMGRGGSAGDNDADVDVGAAHGHDYGHEYSNGSGGGGDDDDRDNPGHYEYRARKRALGRLERDLAARASPVGDLTDDDNYFAVCAGVDGARCDGNYVGADPGAVASALVDNNLTGGRSYSAVVADARQDAHGERRARLFDD